MLANFHNLFEEHSVNGRTGYEKFKTSNNHTTTAITLYVVRTRVLISWTETTPFDGKEDEKLHYDIFTAYWAHLGPDRSSALTK